MDTERDTHFQGFARLLWTAIVQSPEWPTINLDEETIQQAETIIAQRAYDLVNYALEVCPLESFEILGGAVQDVPDLTEWPKPK